MTEPWPAYPPEVNAGRFVAGAGPETFFSNAAAWEAHAALIREQAAALVALVALAAAVTANMLGSGAEAFDAAIAPFTAWLEALAAAADVEAIASAAIGTSWVEGNAQMIPVEEVQRNLSTNAALNATNFMGINSGAIAANEAQYAEYWAQNGSAMVSYDAAVTMLSSPREAPPPPPLASAVAALAGLSAAAARRPSRPRPSMPLPRPRQLR